MTLISIPKEIIYFRKILEIRITLTTLFGFQNFESLSTQTEYWKTLTSLIIAKIYCPYNKFLKKSLTSIYFRLPSNRLSKSNKNMHAKGVHLDKDKTWYHRGIQV